MSRFTNKGVWLVCAILLLAWGGAESAPQAEPQANQPAPPAEAERIRLTNTANELEVFPAFSPKGDLLAYSSDRTGAHEIYVRRMDGTGVEHQVTKDGRHNVQADWSPDGKLIAYHSVVGDGIWVVPAEGGTPRQVAKFGSDPAWSPDGKTIAFQSEPLEALSLYTYSGMPPSTIWLVPAEGGAPKELTRAGEPHGGHGAPAWSADGQRITFVSSDIEPSGELWSVSAKGTDLKHVQGTLMPRDPFFAPDGSTLFYSSPDPGRGFRWGVWKISHAGGKPAVVSTLPARHITLTRDGCQAVVSEMGMAGNLWTLPINEKGEATGPAGPFTNDPDDRSSQPSFSPDGKRIAVHRVVDGNRFQIWLTDPEGKTRDFLTREATYGAGPPVWLPDGKHLVFNSRPEPGKMRLKKINLETKQVETYRELDPSWGWIRLSPEGQRVAFNRSSKGSVGNIWMLPSLDAAEPKQVTFDKEGADFPMWSPDGKYLAVRLRRGSDTQIGVVSADGGEVKQLTSGQGENWLPSWSPDSSKIAFAGMRKGVWDIYWVSREGGPIHKVTSQPDKLTTWVRYPVWYPTGDRIIFEHSATLGDLWLLNTCPGGQPQKAR
jgi:TolB protein